MSAAAPRGLTAERFVSSDWDGQGVVRSLFGRPLRRFSIAYRASWSQGEQAYLVEEHVRYEGGGELARSWHVAAEPDGAMVGLEPSQGGRMFVSITPRGLRIRYDRLRFIRGPNVVNIVVDARLQPDGRVRARGVTRLFGVLPLIHTEVVFTPAPAAANC